jgi:signal transduction histidine kinase
VPIYILLPTYAIFRYKLFDLQFVLKKSILYSVLIFSVTTIYFLFVYILGLSLGKIAGIQSLPVILIIFTAITLLFKPIERRIQNTIDKFFYKKPAAELSAENFLMRSQLLDRDKMKAVATLAAGMAHEIKNPLTTIKTFAEYLPLKYADEEYRSKFSKLVAEEVDRINKIVSHLLEFSKPASTFLETISVSRVLSETIDMLTNDLVKRDIKLNKELDEDALILGDKNQLRQAFLNIFLNSIQAINGPGQLHVTAKKVPKGVLVSVRDTGCGIANDRLQQVFDPFYTTKEEGTGLGLSIVHTIIRHHGGRIEIESKEGVGTTVNVFLKSQN